MKGEDFSMDDLLELLTPKFRGWGWVRLSDGRKVFNVKIANENGVSKIAFDGEFSESEVRQTVLKILQREKGRRQEAAKRAVETRAIRRKQDVYRAAKLYAENNLTPSRRCLCCKRVITDLTSFQRGVGSECWQEVLRVFETLSREKPPVEV